MAQLVLYSLYLIEDNMLSKELFSRYLYLPQADLFCLFRLYSKRSVNLSLWAKNTNSGPLRRNRWLGLSASKYSRRVVGWMEELIDGINHAVMYKLVCLFTTPVTNLCELKWSNSQLKATTIRIEYGDRKIYMYYSWLVLGSTRQLSKCYVS